jgi:antitoxin component YwqK of YwqJK toxin-antitoxin module
MKKLLYLLFGKKNLIQENGVCKIYYERNLTKKFNLSNGLLDGKYESYNIRGDVSMTMNFKQGKLNGEQSKFFSVKNCFDWVENYADGILISRQKIRKTDGYDPNTIFGRKYELGPIETEEPFEKIVTMYTKEEEIRSLRKEVTFKLLADNSGINEN